MEDAEKTVIKKALMDAKEFHERVMAEANHGTCAWTGETVSLMNTLMTRLQTAVDILEKK